MGRIVRLENPTTEGVVAKLGFVLLPRDTRPDGSRPRWATIPVQAAPVELPADSRTDIGFMLVAKGSPRLSINSTKDAAFLDGTNADGTSPAETLGVRYATVANVGSDDARVALFYSRTVQIAGAPPTPVSAVHAADIVVGVGRELGLALLVESGDGAPMGLRAEVAS